MASSTARYRFEFRLLDWSERTSRSLCGERRAMFVGIRPDGSVRRIYFAPSGESFEGERKTVLAEANPHWFVFTPHSEAGGGYMEWFEVDRRIAERWLDRKLEPADFMDVRSSANREDWPTTWRVLVG